MTKYPKNVAPQLIINIDCGVLFMNKLIEQIIIKTKQLIDSEDFIRKHRIGNSFTRTRKLSFPNLLYYILASENKSIGVNLAEIRQHFPHLQIPLISKQAISKARQKISSGACLELCQYFSGLYYKQKNDFELWNGYHIYAIDGSTIQIPVSDENIDFWGSNPNQYGKEEPLASASLMYDVIEGIVIDSHIDKYRLNERTVAEKHIDFFMNLHITGKHLFLFDRGYPSYDLFSKMINNKLFFVMRLSASFKKLIQLDSCDSVVMYTPKGAKVPLKLRCVHFPVSDGSMEYLVTNITDPTFDIAVFKELYFLRWGIEGKYKEIKVSFKLEAFSGYKPEIIKQDFYSLIFISNLAALIKNATDARIERKANNKYRYQANKNFIINRVKKCIIHFLTQAIKIVTSIINDMMNEAFRNRSEIRPDRRFPRHKKYTRRKCYMNNKPCI